MGDIDEEPDWEEVERASAQFGCPPTMRVYAIECQRAGITRVRVGMAQFPEEDIEKERKQGWWVVMLGQTERLTEEVAQELLEKLIPMTPVQKREWARGRNPVSLQ